MGKEIMKRNYDNEGKLISKECSCCHEIKTASEFSKDNGAIDGLQLQCKECRKKYYQENKNKIKEKKEVLKRNYDNEGKLISKECTCCHEVKPVSEFSKCKSKTDGLQAKCKECIKKYIQENKGKIKEKKKVMQRNYDNEGKLISKECSCCHKVKQVSEFNKCKKNNDGLQLKCKKCINEYSKQYQKDNAESIKEYRKQYQKEYRKNNAESIKEYNKQYQKNNAESIKEHRKEYRKNNAESIKEYRKQYYIDNAERIKEHGKQYRKDNAEHYKEYYKEYNKNNAERVKEHNKEYNTKKAQEALQKIKIEVESNPDKYNYIINKEIFGIIYLVHNTESDNYYVGQTTVGFDNRYPKGWLYEHSYKDTVKHDLKLYGENSFEYIKIFKVAYSQYELDKLEAYYIDYYNSYENGYNENRGNVFTNRGKEDIE